jgi:hypothetical protein
MKVLKATQQQYESLNGYQSGVHKLEFVKDADDNWIVGVNVKSSPVFSGIHDTLSELEEIEYNPIIEES